MIKHDWNRKLWENDDVLLKWEGQVIEESGSDGKKRRLKKRVGFWKAGGLKYSGWVSLV
jgi:hypothetical protein